MAIALESAFQSATASLYEEITQLKAEVLQAEQAKSHRNTSQILEVCGHRNEERYQAEELKDIESELLERVRDRIAEGKAPEPQAIEPQV